jgi:hypothetical protein
MTFLPGAHFDCAYSNNDIVKISPAQPRKMKISFFPDATGT